MHIKYTDKDGKQRHEYISSHKLEEVSDYFNVVFGFGKADENTVAVVKEQLDKLESEYGDLAIFDHKDFAIEFAELIKNGVENQENSEKFNKFIEENLEKFKYKHYLKNGGYEEQICKFAMALLNASSYELCRAIDMLYERCLIEAINVYDAGYELGDMVRKELYDMNSDPTFEDAEKLTQGVDCLLRQKIGNKARNDFSCINDDGFISSESAFEDELREKFEENINCFEDGTISKAAKFIIDNSDLMGRVEEIKAEVEAEMKTLKRTNK